MVLVEDINELVTKHLDWTIRHSLELNTRQELMKEALEQLTNICKTILNLFYYQRFSMEAIKDNMGYNSEEVARTTKKKCMRKLEIIVKETVGG